MSNNIQKKKLFRNIASGETTLAYWEKVLDGKLLGTPLLIAQDGRWLDPRAWVVTETDNSGQYREKK